MWALGQWIMFSDHMPLDPSACKLVYSYLKYKAKKIPRCFHDDDDDDRDIDVWRRGVKFLRWTS